MAREYTEDEVSGRSVLAMFRHLKDWVVEQFSDVDHIVDGVADDVDALDTRVTQLEEKEDAGIRSIHLSPFEETVGNVGYIGVEETHTNPSGGTGSSNVLLMSRDPSCDRDDCGMTADAIQTLVAGAGGGAGVTQTMAARRSYAEGFSDRNSDYIQLGHLTKTPMHFRSSTSGGAQFNFGVPICSVDEHAVILGAPAWFVMNNSYDAMVKYNPSGEPYTTPRLWIYPYDEFNAASIQAWGLEEGKHYLMFDCCIDTDMADPSSLSEIMAVTGTGLLYLSVFESDDFTCRRIYKDAPAYHTQPLSVVVTYDSTQPSIWIGSSGYKGIPVGVSASVTDDNSQSVPCAIKFDIGSGYFGINECVPLAGTFTNGNSYTVTMRFTSLY